ncbi:MAG: SusC/RagA family TonB-linked outer membrane protein [Bacteroidales bacterium]|nr:MAG: SusC/RagA family TonB-linked outer membrane protein [Bacteroidales bacterium]
MKKKFTVLLGLFLFLGLPFVFAQTSQITGTVTSAQDGLGIPGVSVIVKGTTTGVVTDIDGKYSLNVPSNSTLVFSFVGMKTQEIEVGGRALIDVVLESESLEVEELVVVGYGVQRKKEVSGSVSTVKGDNLKTIPVQSFEQALTGKASGVNVTIPNAVLGNPTVIRVRGYNSISGSSSPLVIVDGVPIMTGDVSRSSAALNFMGDVNPSDIASVEVLKDASATAIYGSRATNGVMLITTKRGVEGNVKVTYDGSVGFSNAYNLFKVMNAEQFVEAKNFARANSSLAAAYFLNVDANGKTIDTDWNKYVYQRGFQSNHNLSVSGANKTTTYFLSAGYSKTKGVIITNTLEKKSIRMNIDHKLNKFITLGVSASYSNSFTNAPQTGSLSGGNFATAGVGRMAFQLSPIVGPYLSDGTYNIEASINQMGRLNNTESTGYLNPVFLTDNNYNTAQSDRIISTLFANVKIVKGLYFRTAYGMDNSQVESKQLLSAAHGDGWSTAGQVSNYNDRRNRWNWTNTLNYDLSLKEKFNIKLMAGSEQQYTKSNGWSGRKNGITDNYFEDYQGAATTPQQPPSATVTENFFISYFGRVNFNYDKKYFIEFSARRDGFSGLAVGNKYGNFGGASLMWNVSNENLFKNSFLANYISDLRLKASAGRVGNISGVDNYASLFLYSANVYNSLFTLNFNQAGNPDLQWETSDKYDAGIAFGFLKERIQVDFSYYKNTVNGLILDVPQSPSKGIPGGNQPTNTLPMNVGSMFNKGFELAVTSYNIIGKQLRWSTTFNFGYLKNEVTELADGLPYITGVTQLENTNRTTVGSPVGMIWGVKTAGVDPTTGRRIFIRKNLDASGVWDGTTSKVYYDPNGGMEKFKNEDGSKSRDIDITYDGWMLGNTIPKYFGGIDNTVTYGNFDFNLGLTYALDFYVYFGSKAGMEDQRNWNNSEEFYKGYWRNPGDVTDFPKPVWGDNVSNGSTMVQSRNVFRGDFLKVRNISLGYTLKHQLLNKVGVSSVRLYGQVFNLYTFTNYPGSDPEISSGGDTNLTPGVDRNTVPQARTFSFGLNLTF